MKIEKLLYVYLFVCAAMIIFNFATAFVLKRKDKRCMKISASLYNKVSEQIERVKSGLGVEEKHKKYLSEKLKRTGNMIAFDKILERMIINEGDYLTEYLSELSGVFMITALNYSRKDRIEAAYFPYIIKKYKLIKGRSFSGIIDMLFLLLDEKSIYCRENAMQAIYTTGDEETVVKALKVVDKSDKFYHEKLIADGLLNFEGDREKLCLLIKENYFSFKPQMQVALLNFFRFGTENFKEFAYSVLTNEKNHTETRLSALRYLGKYPFEEAREYLLNLAAGAEKRWEFRAVASSALSAYPGEDTADRLKENLYSPNWYIRYNSAQSLEKLGFGYLDLIDVMEGKDRYATEILRYRFDLKDISQKEVGINV